MWRGIVCIVALLIIIVPILIIPNNLTYGKFVAQVQPPWVDMCNEDAPCEIRVAYSGRLYMYQQSSAHLYVSSPDRTTFESYDLSSYIQYPYNIFGLFDFVLFEELDWVVFYSEQAIPQMRIYNLATRQMQPFELPGSEKVVKCNRYKRFNYVPPQYISQIGTDNQLIICSLNDNNEFQASIVDVVSQTVIKSVNLGDLPNHETGLYHPWDNLVGGMDGQLYVGTPATTAGVLESILADADGAAPTDTVIFRFHPQTDEWVVTKLSPQQRHTHLFDNPASVGQGGAFYAADTQGRYYFHLNWYDATVNLSHTEITRVDPITNEVAQITNLDISGIGYFAGVSLDGQVLIRQGDTLAQALVKNINEYVVTPAVTPTLTKTPAIQSP